MADLPITGHCLCGGVSYEIDAPFVSASYCHCTRCQRRTGCAASASGRVAPGALRIVAGDDLVRAYAPEDGFLKCFCSACGGALWSKHRTEDAFGVRLGTVDGDPGIRPQWHQFTAYAASWEAIPDDGLPRFPEQRPS
jgi:hypothetical protein